MRGEPNRRAAATFYTHAPAAGNAATETAPKATGVTHVLHWIHWSIDKLPDAATGVAVTVVSGSTTLFTQYVAAKGTNEAQLHGSFDFRPTGLHGAANEALVVTVGDPGATQKATVNFAVT
jgi:hypothetical protein